MESVPAAPGWPYKSEHAHLPVNKRLNVLFGNVPGFTMNPMYLLELPVTIALTVTNRAEFRASLLLPMFLLYMFKECACMSICLHRYFSHKGFKCGRMTQFVLYWLGCIASQGPPLWWASKHRRHHSHCDTKNDPHSPVAHGCWYAWLGWAYMPGCEGPHGSGVDEKLIKDLTQFPELLFMENFHCLPVYLCHFLAFKYGGLPFMVFVSMWSSVLCQVLTMYFNVAFHQPHSGMDEARDALDKGGSMCHSNDLPFDPLSQLFGEAYHNWHHKHPHAMLRPGIDLPYWTMIKPLLLLGVFTSIDSRSD